MSFWKNLFGRGSKDPLSALTSQLDLLGTKPAIMPVELFQLANSFVEYADQQAVIDALTNEKYANHKSMYVRRVVIIALRRMQVFDNPAVTQLMFGRLSDPVGWVAYDAAWFFREAKTGDEKIIRKLTELAGDKVTLSADALKQVADANLSDAGVRAQLEAVAALQAIQGLAG